MYRRPTWNSSHWEPVTSPGVVWDRVQIAIQEAAAWNFANADYQVIADSFLTLTNMSKFVKLLEAGPLRVAVLTVMIPATEPPNLQSDSELPQSQPQQDQQQATP